MPGTPLGAGSSPPTGRRRATAGAGLAGLVVAAGFLGAGGRGSEPEGVEARRDLVYREVGGRRARLDLYRPRGAPPTRGWPLVVAIHGGGWTGGSKDDFGPTMVRLARSGVAVAAVDYRLARSGRPSWPENFDDVREAVRWLRRHADRLDLDPGRFAALGASAGGHLAALVGTWPEGSGPPGDASARVAAVIDFYGPADLADLAGSPGAESAAARMLGGPAVGSRGLYERASPIRHVDANDPPFLLIHGDRDRTVPPEQSRRMAEALNSSGVRHRLIEVEGVGHGFGLRAGERDLLPEILEFLTRAWDDTR